MENIVSNILSLTSNFKPVIGVVLGSGLGGFTSCVDIKHTIPYSSIEGFPVSTVEGHEGALIFGYIADVPLVIMKGRFHYYEGYSTPTITTPIRVMHLLGVKTLILSNAAGAINTSFELGDIMLLNNHLNFLPNPLIGANDSRFGVRFPDMKQPYSKELIALAHSLDHELQEGVYAALTGPSYETAAEVNMLRLLGADAVGMSTVPEVIVANHCGMQVLALSVITNDTRATEVTHQEVMEIGAQASIRLSKLVKGIVGSLL